ncbi:hypothetical protein ACIBL8_45075 [Streptomyces sp. NPDC050523]|uniref:hypothetical protein n=1 Tax=Streptomyces sp. NPDC050523 TaxID=3365622 RepID=UPI0037A1E515
MRDVIVLDGFLDTEIMRDTDGSTVRFRLTVSPTDERTDEMILPCSVINRATAAAVLDDLSPGDQLRVTGHLRLPRTLDEPMWLAVTNLEVLTTAPVLTNSNGAFAIVVERYDTYLCYLDVDADQVSVWTEAGTWVGTAATPADLTDLLDTYEQAHGVGGE